MSILNLMTKADNLKSVLDKTTDDLAKELAKEVLTNNLEMKDLQKIVNGIPVEIAMEVMIKTLSIVSKSTSTTSSPEHSTSRRSNRNLFS